MLVWKSFTVSCGSSKQVSEGEAPWTQNGRKVPILPPSDECSSSTLILDESPPYTQKHDENLMSNSV